MSSRKVLILILLCTIAISCCCNWADGASHHRAPAPAPSASVDCTALILNMADCLSFVSNGSTSTKPEGSCCSGLKTVVSTKAECICEAFKSSAQFGVVLNATKALSLPSLCKINAAAASNCGFSMSPFGAPAPGTGGKGGAAPVPSPGDSGSNGLSISAGSLIIGLAVASSCSF